MGFALGNAQLDLGAAWSQRSEAGEGILVRAGMAALEEPKFQQGFLLGSGILPPSPAPELFPWLEVADGTQGSILRGEELPELLQPPPLRLASFPGSANQNYWRCC